MNSWLPSMRSPDRAATARALDTASVRPMSVKASAAGASMRQVPAEKSGNDRSGIAEGIAPIVGTFATPVRESA